MVGQKTMAVGKKHSSVSTLSSADRAVSAAMPAEMLDVPAAPKDPGLSVGMPRAVEQLVKAGASASITASDNSISQLQPQPGNPMEVLGAAIWLLMQTPEFRNLPIGALEALIGVPYRLGQLRLYRNKGKPFAVAAWAYVNEEVEKRLQAGGEGLKPEEWRCGKIMYLIFLVAPYGKEAEIRSDLAGSAGRVVERNATRSIRQNSLESVDSVEGEPIALGPLSEKVRDKLKKGKIVIERMKSETDMQMAARYVFRINSESRMAGGTLSMEKCLKLVRRALERPKEHSIFVARHSETQELTGCLIGSVGEKFYSRDRAATILAWQMLPAFRGGGSAILLLDSFMQWAMAAGVRDIFVHVTSNDSIVQSDRLMRRLGFSYTGGNYRFALPMLEQ